MHTKYLNTGIKLMAVAFMLSHSQMSSAMILKGCQSDVSVKQGDAYPTPTSYATKIEVQGEVDDNNDAVIIYLKNGYVGVFNHNQRFAGDGGDTYHQYCVNSYSGFGDQITFSQFMSTLQTNDNWAEVQRDIYSVVKRASDSGQSVLIKKELISFGDESRAKRWYSTLWQMLASNHHSAKPGQSLPREGGSD